MVVVGKANKALRVQRRRPGVVGPDESGVVGGLLHLGVAIDGFGGAQKHFAGGTRAMLVLAGDARESVVTEVRSVAAVMAGQEAPDLGEDGEHNAPAGVIWMVQVADYGVAGRTVEGDGAFAGEGDMLAPPRRDSAVSDDEGGGEAGRRWLGSGQHLLRSGGLQGDLRGGGEALIAGARAGGWWPAGEGEEGRGSAGGATVSVGCCIGMLSLAALPRRPPPSPHSHS